MEKTLKMGYRTNEFYIEYLELKTEIAELVQRASWAKNVYIDGGRGIQEKLDEDLERMKVVLWELNAGGVTAEKLLYLSWGIEVE